MKAWRATQKEVLKLEELPSKTAEGNFVKVKTLYSAVSDTDKMIYLGDLTPPQFPFTLGRQAVGMVTEVGEDVTNVERGDRVAIDPYVFCEDCKGCKEKKCTECTECADIKMYGVNADGLLSDFVIVPCQDVFKLPEHVSSKDSIYLGHIALAQNIISKLDLQKGEHVVIMGASVVGIILAQIALYYQAVPIVVDTRQERLDILENLGVYYCINSVNEDVNKKIFSLTGGKNAEALVYISFAGQLLSRSLDLVMTNGKVIIAGWSGTKPDLSGSFYNVFNKQLTVYGVSNGAKLIPVAINMLANKIVKVSDMTSKEVEFNEVDKMIKEQAEHKGKYIKVMVRF